MSDHSAHTVKAFDDDLGQLRALVSEMGGRAEGAIQAAMQDDKRIDAIEAEIERQVVRLIALRAPMADDLREVLAALKISAVIERMGDYAKNIARRVPLLQDASGIEPISILPAMARAVSDMVKATLDAFVARDAEAAIAVCESDRAVDEFYNSLFRALLTHMMENPHTITASTHFLFVAKNLERIGDHATNVAEMVYFAATGEQMAERVKGEEIG
jgi:phosphate transport system protein